MYLEVPSQNNEGRSVIISCNTNHSLPYCAVIEHSLTAYCARLTHLTRSQRFPIGGTDMSNYPAGESRMKIITSIHPTWGWLLVAIILQLISNGRWIALPVTWLAPIGWLVFLERTRLRTGAPTAFFMFMMVMCGIMWLLLACFLLKVKM